MKIGVCASVEKAPLLKKLGFDYIEPALNQLVTMEEETFQRLTDLLQEAGISAESFNNFFPGDTVLYAPCGDQAPLLAAVEDYAEKCFARAAKWGGKIAVIGSGWVRKIPDGMSREEADRQFARVLAVCGAVAERYGMRIVVEPLSQNECNYIHTIEEAASLAALSGHPAVGVNLDFYHHAKNGDDLASLPANGRYLWHAHIARPTDRKAPKTEDEDLLCAYAQMLTYCAEVERISLECRWGEDYDGELGEAASAMEIFRWVRAEQGGK